MVGPEWVAGKQPGEAIELDDINARTLLAGGWIEPWTEPPTEPDLKEA